ncbi:MAG: hypothetical protein LC722_07540, partial [Actinobacteria bacterium]|nr:hypothetical protein [Actinomycetota bacterium]
RPIDVAVARRSAAAPFLGLGGLVLAVSTFLSWAKFDQEAQGGGGQDSASGLDLSDGRLLLGIGLALILLAAYTGMTRRLGHWFDADLLGLALSTIALAVAGATWAAIPDRVSPDIGLYVALAGGAIAFLGSLLALIAGRRNVVDDRSARGDTAIPV